MKNLKWVLGLSLSLMLVLSACTQSETKSAAKFDKNDKVTLKVMYFNDQAFYSQYGNLFKAKYPNIDFEVITTMGVFGGEGKDPVKEFDKLIEEQKPDIIMMNTDQYEKLSADGKLYDLDSVIQQDKFDVENMVPGVIELLKDKGGSKLYGLSPSFSTQALFYNKDLFDKQGIPYPTDKMSWEDVLKLAKRFPSTGTDDTRVYGLAQSVFTQNPFDLVKTIAQSKQLSFLDAAGKNITMDTNDWKNILEQVVDGYQNKYISRTGGGGNEPGQVEGSGGKVAMRIDENSNLFLAGRAAMMIDSSFLLNQMDIMKNMQKDAKSVNWGVVTEPVDPANPDVGDSFSLSQIFGVNAQSGHVGAAWEFIKYIHSDEVAKIRSKSSSELISRSAYAVDKKGQSLEAFYKLKPSKNTTIQQYPKGFRASLSSIASTEMKAAVSKSKTVDEALAAIKAKGQEELTKANISGEKETGGEMGDLGVGVQSIFIN